MKLRINPKFGVINRAVRLVFCLNEKFENREIGNKDRLRKVYCVS